MKPAPTLRDLQHWLKWVITDPRGVAPAIEDPSPSVEEYQDRYTSPTESQLSWIGDERISSIRRLDVYAEGYFFRILECLAKDFPKTKQALGDEVFSKIVSQYLKAYPSKSSSIDEVGCRFSEFISKQPDLPYGWVPDLTLLEWNQIEAFYAPETIVDSNWWEAADLQNDTELRFRVSPSVRLIGSRWSLPRVLDALDSNVLNQPESHFLVPSYLIVYRHDDFHCWDEVEGPIFEVLQNLKSGLLLEAATARLGDDQATELSNAFSRWVSREIICGVNEGASS